MGVHLRGNGLCNRISPGGQRLPDENEVCTVLQPAGAYDDVPGGGGHPDRRYAEPARAGSGIQGGGSKAQRDTKGYGTDVGGTGGACAKRHGKPHAGQYAADYQ